MSRLISLSVAGSIAIHGMILIGRSKEALNVAHIAKITGTSRHHVAKVMQRLSKEGYLSSQRGPAGGFSLNKPPEKISFLDIYEAIEGKVIIPECMMDNEVCPFDKCIMNNILNDLSREFKNYLNKQLISDYINKTS